MGPVASDAEGPPVKNIDVDPMRALILALLFWSAGLVCALGVYLSEGTADTIWSLGACLSAILACLSSVLVAVGIEQDRK